MTRYITTIRREFEVFASGQNPAWGIAVREMRRFLFSDSPDFISDRAQRGQRLMDVVGREMGRTFIFVWPEDESCYLLEEVEMSLEDAIAYKLSHDGVTIREVSE